MLVMYIVQVEECIYKHDRTFIVSIKILHVRFNCYHSLGDAVEHNRDKYLVNIMTSIMC